MELIPYAIKGVNGLLYLSIILAFYRLLKGPRLTDRVVALDFIATIVVGIIGLYTIETGEFYYLKVAIVLALLMFLGTVAMAFFVEKREDDL